MRVFVNNTQTALIWPRCDEEGKPLSSCVIPMEVRSFRGFNTAFIHLSKCSEELRNQITINYEQWAPCLSALNIEKVCLQENRIHETNLRAYSVNIVDMQGAQMNNLREFNLSETLINLKRSPDDHISVISMITDAPIWTTDFNLPYEGVSYPDWVRRNRDGHVEEELRRYKEQIARYGQTAIDVAKIDFSMPHLQSFAYEAKWLGDLNKRLSICVDAWGASFGGEPVRITRHTRKPKLID